jgi:hypothetical protein
MIGANGTPLIKSAVMIGMTPQEQKGLNAPTAVAAKIATIGSESKTRLMCLDTPDILMATAIGMVTNR